MWLERVAAIAAALFNFFPIAVLGSFLVQGAAERSAEFMRDTRSDWNNFYISSAGGREVKLAGRFVEGLADNFRGLLAIDPRIEVVHLDSPGGDVAEAERLHDVIREHHLVTYVPNRCLSSCLIVFIGGRDRWIDSHARFGFHGPRPGGSSDADYFGARLSGNLRALEGGLSNAFLELAERTSPGDIWYVSPNVISAAGLGFEVAAPSQFPKIEGLRLFEGSIPPEAPCRRNDPVRARCRLH